MKNGYLTPADLADLYEKLSADLPGEAVQHVSGDQSRKGYDMTGYAYQYVVNRLNEVAFGHWRAIHEMKHLENGKTEKGRILYRKACLVTIQIGNWRFIEGQNVFEVLAEAQGYGGHESIEEASALKGAYTNAFKKAAAMLGVGKKAYEGLLDEDFLAPDQTQPQQRPQPQRKQTTKNTKKPAKQTENNAGKMNEGQVNAIKKLVMDITGDSPAKKKMLENWVAQRIDGFPGLTEEMTSAMAAETIRWLNHYKNEQRKKAVGQ